MKPYDKPQMHIVEIELENSILTASTNSSSYLYLNDEDEAKGYN